MVSTDLNSRMHSGKCTGMRRGSVFRKKPFGSRKGCVSPEIL